MAQQQNGDASSIAQYDHVILGGGTAGCVLAARLSERPDRRVLLVEAGCDTPAGAIPEDILDPYPTSYLNPAYRWHLTGHATTADQSPSAPLLHARVLGGGSSIMGMVMLRGTPDDYDAWAQLGAAGWAWADVLPFFKRLENDLDFGGAMHGRDGPTEIRRHPQATWPPIAIAAKDFARKLELPFVDDLNGDFRDGYGPVPIAGTPTRRATSAGAYLTQAVRTRANLDIMCDTEAQALFWSGSRVTGVRLARGTESLDVAAREVTLSMGALLSPAFLMAQGIGDADMLRDAGVEVRHHLPGVGRNLQNHSALTIAAHIKRRGLQRRPQRNHNNSMFRYSSGHEGSGAADMSLSFGSRLTWHAIAARVAHFGIVTMAPHSRGQVRLRPGSDAALIEYNLLGDRRDELRLLSGVDLLAGLTNLLANRQLIGQPVPVARYGAAKSFAARNLRNRFMTQIIATAADIVPLLGEAMIASLGKAGMRWHEVLHDPAARTSFVHANLTPLGHHAGTCRMGTPGDSGAVVDSAGRVHGISGLRVADASIMPTIPRANTNLPTLMITEKIAAAIIAEN